MPFIHVIQTDSNSFGLMTQNDASDADADADADASGSDDIDVVCAIRRASRGGVQGIVGDAGPLRCDANVAVPAAKQRRVRRRSRTTETTPWGRGETIGRGVYEID